jgi:hypothetical protein
MKRRRIPIAAAAAGACPLLSLAQQLAQPTPKVYRMRVMKSIITLVPVSIGTSLFRVH